MYKTFCPRGSLISSLKYLNLEEITNFQTEKQLPQGWHTICLAKKKGKKPTNFFTWHYRELSKLKRCNFIFLLWGTAFLRILVLSDSAYSLVMCIFRAGNHRPIEFHSQTPACCTAAALHFPPQNTSAIVHLVMLWAILNTLNIQASHNPWTQTPHIPF